MRQRPPELQSNAVLRIELDRASARLGALRRDPAFLTADSDVSVEHSRLSRRAAVLRAELNGNTGNRGQARPTTPRY